MPPPCELTPTQVLEGLLNRLEKRMEALQRVKLDGFQMVISEMEALRADAPVALSSPSKVKAQIGNDGSRG